MLRRLLTLAVSLCALPVYGQWHASGTMTDTTYFISGFEWGKTEAGQRLDISYAEIDTLVNVMVQGVDLDGDTLFVDKGGDPDTYGHAGAANTWEWTIGGQKGISFTGSSTANVLLKINSAAAYGGWLYWQDAGVDEYFLGWSDARSSLELWSEGHGLLWQTLDGVNDFRFSGGISVDSVAAPTSGIALGSSSALNWNSGDVTVTHSANA